MDTTQLHPYYFGWYITEERSALHEKVFEERFGTVPQNHRGYLKSCFNDVDPAETARQIKAINHDVILKCRTTWHFETLLYFDTHDSPVREPVCFSR